VLIVPLEGQGAQLVKLIGFGHAMKIGANRFCSSLFTNNNLFQAPEAENSQYAEKLDIWGCGIILL
jgi:hypothetical protein